MSTATSTVQEWLGSGTVARLAGLDSWMVGRLVERGLITPRARCGRYSLWTRADLPRIREAAEHCGYLPRADVPA